MSNRSLLSQGYDPLIIMAKHECVLGKKLIDIRKKSDTIKNSDKISLPEYLNPLDKQRVTDPISNQQITSYVVGKFERDQIPYIAKKLEIADYIAKNKNDGSTIVIKRMTMESILDMWIMRKRGNYYEGKRGFKNMMKDLRSNFAPEIPVILAIEDYHMSMFDNNSNLIWTSWKMSLSNKKDSRGHPKWCTTHYKRYSIHPYSFQKTMEEIARKYDIQVKHFFDGKGVYSFITDHIFRREYDEESTEYRYDANKKVDYLVEIIPFLNREQGLHLLERFDSIYGIISAFILEDNPTKLPIENIDEKEYRKWRSVMSQQS